MVPCAGESLHIRPFEKNKNMGERTSLLETAVPLQKLLSELSQLPPQAIVLFTTLFQDGVGARRQQTGHEAGDHG